MSKQNIILLCILGSLLFGVFICASFNQGGPDEYKNTNVSIQCSTGILKSIDKTRLMDVRKSILPDEGSYEGDFCVIANDGVILHTHLMSNNARRYFTIVVANTGNTNIKFNPFKMKLKRNLCSYKRTDDSVLKCVNQEDSFDFLVVMETASNQKYYGDEYDFKERFIDRSDDKYILKPGEKVYGITRIKWPIYKTSDKKYYCETDMIVLPQ